MSFDEEEIESLIQIPDTDEPRYVLSKDPGGTTGVCLIMYTPNLPFEVIYLDEVPKGMAGYFKEFEGSFPNEFVSVVSERWVTNNKKKGVDLTPHHIEGVQYAFWQGSVFYQDPSMKSIVPDQKLKDNNLWVPGHRHAMDALIHGIVWLFRHGHKPTQEMLSDRAGNPNAQPGETGRKMVERDEDGEKVEEPAEGSPEAGEGDDGDGEHGDNGGGGGDGKDREGRGEVMGKNKKAKELNRSFSGYDIAESDDDAVDVLADF